MRRQGRHSGLVAIAALLSALSVDARAAEYTIDPARTVVTFAMRSLGTTQRGELNRTAGTVALDAAAGTGQVDIVIDARSVKAGSEPVSKFVRGPALLNVAAHPEIAYHARRVIFVDGKPGRIEGELTLLGVTRAVALDVSQYECAAARCLLTAATSLKRSTFGMTRYLMFASDDVTLAIRAEGVTSAGTDADSSG